MDTSTTGSIVEALTRAIVEHRLQPGSKLAEQKLADHFGVSRTLVRQALFQLAQNRLIRLEPARGAFVASPSVDEARQVFAVRRMLETEMTRAFVRTVSPERIQALRDHVALLELVVALVVLEVVAQGIVDLREHPHHVVEGGLLVVRQARPCFLGITQGREAVRETSHETGPAGS